MVSFFGMNWCHLPCPTSWANYQLCTASFCLSKGLYCCSKFLRGFMKTVLALSQMSSYKLLWRQDVFYLLILLPSGVFDVVFFHLPLFQFLMLLFFMSFSFIPLSTYILFTYDQYAKYFQLIFTLSSVWNKLYCSIHRTSWVSPKAILKL